MRSENDLDSTEGPKKVLQKDRLRDGKESGMLPLATKVASAYHYSLMNLTPCEQCDLQKLVLISTNWWFTSRTLQTGGIF
jgi:hypothetical protein